MKKIIIIIAVGGALLIAYWLVAPLFITNEVNDELPESVMSEEEMQIIIDNMPDQLMDDESPIRIVTTQSITSPTPVVFPITDTTGHPATGDIRVIDTGEDTIVRYENYDGTNGPDLFVYLTKDLDAQEFVSLGRSKGNVGNANYTVPANVDISEYKYVMTWCRAFGVLFDYAEIN